MFIGRFKLIVKWLIFEASARIILFYIISRQSHWKVLYSAFVLYIFFADFLVVFGLNLRPGTARNRIKMVRIWLNWYSMVQWHIFCSFWLINHTLFRGACWGHLEFILRKIERRNNDFWNHHLLLSKSALLQVFWIIVICFYTCGLADILVRFERTKVSRVLAQAIRTYFLAFQFLSLKVLVLPLRL